jgi:two-component system sensor histidine kinase VicK
VGVSLASEIASGLPKVLADPERVDAILSNLIWNGLKYTPSGGRVVLQATASDGMVELTVADTGKGIAKEEQERLFSPFERADEADQERRRLRGTGLGLFIVKLTVEGMGGRVRMESEPGRGTRVTFTLPAEKRA